MSSWLLVFLAEKLIWGIFLVPLVLIIKNKRLGLWAMANALLVWAVTKFIKDYFYTPRPYIWAQTSIPINYLLDGSFPSSHTAVAFAVSFIIYHKMPRLGAVMLIASAAIGLSRIIIGVHTLLDVTGGIVLAYLGSRLIIRGLDNYHSKY